ncbi:Hypothetical protein R9X50_00292100 [Acrodontium crateriforme]|uniref:Vacuolar protein 14 C-terminal Fig4-binding domain-containing protein n=1 Tax=Acrodontium crateriforme TaxID=150365 RepID=A0AAQ3M4T7_9PEZI|nr:Hypothetical protein R9X50_00292100 [Acrodontium crateriforme]
MDASIAKALSEKLYDKRKAGALDLETSVRTALAEGNHDKIAKIVHQLCQDYAYAVYQPHARNGGLIGLAAAAIALGPEVARYMKEIVPPVLACFSDQDARVRYYACESMYNIAKVAKGEVLLYFNHVFDALCKLASDTELSVKNGAELLDRLIKDIVSESAATYASIYQLDVVIPESEANTAEENMESTIAFSLPRFIPLLKERINVLNPFTRTFLVSWITLLDSIPDLELVAFLPSFFAGLLRFLSDPNPDVCTTTKTALANFLGEIKRIAAVQKGIAMSRKSKDKSARPASVTSTGPAASHFNEPSSAEAAGNEQKAESHEQDPSAEYEVTPANSTTTSLLEADEDDDDYDDDGSVSDGEWIPGQDVQIDYRHILEILVTFLAESSEEEVQVTALTWIEAFLDICPEDILVITPKLLSQLLPSMSHHVDRVREAAKRLDGAMKAYVLSLPGDSSKTDPANEQLQVPQSQSGSSAAVRQFNQANGSGSRRGSVKSLSKPQLPPSSTEDQAHLQNAHIDLDYEAAVTALTDQFIHQHEATRVSALGWLIMLHKKSPRKILAIQEATFPALLKTLSDPAESVVKRDLLLLSQISKSSDDSYFSSFMVNLLRLFATDRRLLEIRGNLIIRQLCLSLPPEKIYRTMADCLERDADEDIEFASIMVQNLNNNLITAPELSDLRKRLRNLDSRDGQTCFTVLFKAWCVNAVATFSLCLLAQAYEQAYELLKVFADLEMTVNHLIQIDKLVQLLESPVFTYLRMQLLEPERYPHLYKCLYGLLMLLPQSSGFAALKNRLNSVSAIGYLHIPTRGNTPQSGSTFERQTRLKSREAGEPTIRWNELLEKFRTTQDRVRRSQQRQQLGTRQDSMEGTINQNMGPAAQEVKTILPTRIGRPNSALSQVRGGTAPVSNVPADGLAGAHTRGKASLSNLTRFTQSSKGKAPKK